MAGWSAQASEAWRTRSSRLWSSCCAARHARAPRWPEQAVAARLVPTVAHRSLARTRCPKRSTTGPALRALDAGRTGVPRPQVASLRPRHGGQPDPTRRTAADPAAGQHIGELRQLACRAWLRNDGDRPLALTDPHETQALLNLARRSPSPGRTLAHGAGLPMAGTPAIVAASRA